MVYIIFTLAEWNWLPGRVYDARKVMSFPIWWYSNKWLKSGHEPSSIHILCPLCPSVDAGEGVADPKTIIIVDGNRLANTFVLKSIT